MPTISQALALALAHQQAGRLDLAEQIYRRILAAEPNHADALHLLGVVGSQVGKCDLAIGCIRRAIELRGTEPAFHNNLGNAFKNQGELDEAVACYRRALELKPDYAKAHGNLGIALQLQRKLQEAVASCRRAIELEPRFAEAHVYLGSALLEQGRLDDATACYQQAVALNPACAMAHNYYLYALRYDSDITPAALVEAHAEFDRRHAAGFRSAWRAPQDVPEPGRRLRLGFVSPVFSFSPVGSFLIGVLENLDRAQCEVVCYSDRLVPDGLTARFKAAAHLWRDTYALSDEQLAGQVRADRVDILFDLAGHTPQNRLLAFARKPAPIQITWIDSVGTTGLSAIDYVLADHDLIPPGTETHYTERVLRMPDGYMCYDPPAAAGDVGPLPATQQGYVTFGSFSRPAKIDPEVVRVWSGILRQVRGSRLVLKHDGFEDPGTIRRFRELFRAEGVEPARLEFQGYSLPSSYYQEYRRIDVTLDPFPHGGGLTVCDSLWMGVPVVTCPGETFAGRQALSHLSNIGLTETIASSLREYEEIAVRLANDLPRVATLRAGLRDRVARSPLCDGKRFAANLMRLLHCVWRQYALLAKRNRPACADARVEITATGQTQVPVPEDFETQA